MKRFVDLREILKMSIKLAKIEPAKKVKSGKKFASINVSKKIKIVKISGKLKNGKNRIIKLTKKNINLAPVSRNPAFIKLRRGKQESIKTLKQEIPPSLNYGEASKKTRNPAFIKLRRGKQENNKTLKQENIKAKRDWTILREDNGEEFALKNLKVFSPKILEDIAVMGLPEAGKRENWNFIKIKDCAANDKKAIAREHKYILDDFDAPEDVNAELIGGLMLGLKCPVSPYVINLKQKIGDEEEKEAPKKYVLPLKFFDISKKIFAVLDKIADKSNIFARIDSRSDSDIDSTLLTAEQDLEKSKPALAPCPSRPAELEIDGRPSLEKKEGVSFSEKFKSFCNKPISFKENFCFEKKMLRPVFNFAVMASLIILPIYGFNGYINAKRAQGRVLGAAAEALNNFNAGGSLLMSNDLNDAKGKFDEAGNGFADAKAALGEINSISYNLAAVVFNKDKELRSANGLIDAGKCAVEISSMFFDGLRGDVIFPEDGSSSADKNYMAALKKINDVLEKEKPKVNDLQNFLAKVDENVLPDEYKSQFKKIKDLVSYVKIKMDGYAQSSDLLIRLSAEKNFKRYLFIFQNNNEIRPTGGFIGSYSLLDIKDGKIVNIETPEQGSYSLQGGLLENIKPPQALTLLNSRWEFQDANWWPDFPASAKFISDIYEKSGGRTVDGVIAINGSLMEDILTITGPIEMKDYNKIIDSENFIKETQKAVELEYDKNENKPKKIISDLMPKVLEKLFKLDNEKFIDVLSIFAKALRKRDIQLFSANSELEGKITALGWGGEIKNVKNRDYLYIVDTNLGGRKTDGVIEQSVIHNTEISENGEIIDELIITKKHNGIKGDFFEGVNNVDYLRVYAPQGSVLLEAEGFEPPPPECFKDLRENISQDELLSLIESKEKTDIGSGTVIGESFGKTYFANWTQVDPGEEITVHLKYKLPFNVMDETHLSPLSRAVAGQARGEQIGKYSIYIQKQAGSGYYSLKKSLFYPDALHTEWSYPGNPDGKNGEWINFDKVGEDKFYGAIFTK